MDKRMKYIWGEINKIAPMLKLSPEDYKYQLGYQVLGNVNGSIKFSSTYEFLEIKNRLISDLNKVKQPDSIGTDKGAMMVAPPVAYPVLDDINNKMRKKIISIAYTIGWAKAGDWKEAVANINRFLLQKGKHKQLLNSLGTVQLSETVSQFEIILKKFYKGVAITIETKILPL